MGPIRVALIGVGNCATALVQGVHYYREASDEAFVAGLLHPRLGGYHAPGHALHIGPSDHVPWLEDRKWAHIRLEGRGFGDQPITLELKLEVWDSPNAAGVVDDAIRCCRLALDRGLMGALPAPSAYLMKSPPEQCADDVARERLERFIAGEG